MLSKAAFITLLVQLFPTSQWNIVVEDQNVPQKTGTISEQHSFVEALTSFASIHKQKEK